MENVKVVCPCCEFTIEFTHENIQNGEVVCCDYCGETAMFELKFGVKQERYQ